MRKKLVILLVIIIREKKMKQLLFVRTLIFFVTFECVIINILNRNDVVITVFLCDLNYYQ